MILLYLGDFYVWNGVEGMVRIYMTCFQTLSFMVTWVFIRVCTAGVNGFMCVVLGENGVFRISDPLVWCLLLCEYAFWFGGTSIGSVVGGSLGVFLSVVLHCYAFAYWSFVYGAVSWFLVEMSLRCFYSCGVIPCSVIGLHIPFYMQ
jgi:hypothetical protein